MGGLSRRSVKIKEIRDQGIRPVILDAGDLIFSTKKIDARNKNAELVRADAMIEGFNRIGCDAINVGHYEMLNGLNYLKRISQNTDIPFISANIKDASTNELIFEPFLILERGELKIGVAGVTNQLPDTSKSVNFLSLTISPLAALTRYECFGKRFSCFSPIIW